MNVLIKDDGERQRRECVADEKQTLIIMKFRQCCCCSGGVITFKIMHEQYHIWIWTLKVVFVTNADNYKC